MEDSEGSRFAVAGQGSVAFVALAAIGAGLDGLAASYLKVAKRVLSVVEWRLQ